MSSVESPVSRMEAEESVYVESMEGVLGLIENSFLSLFEEKAVHTLRMLRQGSTPLSIGDTERSLISRMVLRKPLWLRSSTLFKYSPSGTMEETIAGIRGLQSVEMLDVIDEIAPFEWVWEAVSGCLTIVDLKLLCRLLGNLKCTGSKEEILARLRTVFTTQRDISGRSFSHRAGSLFRTVVDQNYGKDEMFVRINPSTLTILRRFYRLANVSPCLRMLFL